MSKELVERIEEQIEGNQLAWKTAKMLNGDDFIQDWNYELIINLLRDCKAALSQQDAVACTTDKQLAGLEGDVGMLFSTRSILGDGLGKRVLLYTAPPSTAQEQS